MDNDVDVPAIGLVVGARRRVFGWTVHELAERAGVSRSHLMRLERGQVRTVGVGVLVRLAVALEMTVEQLLRYAGVWTGARTVDELREQLELLSPAARETLVRVAQLLVDLEATWRGSGDVTTLDLPE